MKFSNKLSKPDSLSLRLESTRKRLKSATRHLLRRMFLKKLTFSLQLFCTCGSSNPSTKFSKSEPAKLESVLLDSFTKYTNSDSYLSAFSLKAACGSIKCFVVLGVTWS